MTWIETDSLSFTARHDDADLACAHRVLDSLEDLRLRLEDRFGEVPGSVTVILHDNPAWLSAAHPLLPAVRWSAAPAARRYLAGWPMAGEIHTLTDSWMEKRSAGEDSLRALRGTAERMYAQIVLAANNQRCRPCGHRSALHRLPALGLADRGCRPVLHRPDRPLPRGRDHAAAGGRPPAFPSTRRDALILGGTVFDLLDRHAGRTPASGWPLGFTAQGPRATWSSPSRRACATSSAPGVRISTRSSIDSPSPARTVARRRAGAPRDRPRARHAAQFRFHPTSRVGIFQRRGEREDIDDDRRQRGDQYPDRKPERSPIPAVSQAALPWTALSALRSSTSRAAS